MRLLALAMVLTACTSMPAPTDAPALPSDAPRVECNPLCAAECGMAECSIPGMPDNPACDGCVARCEDPTALRCEGLGVTCEATAPFYPARCYR